MENADNLSGGFLRGGRSERGNEIEREREGERKRDSKRGRNNTGCYFIRCCGAVDAQSFHKRCSWANVERSAPLPSHLALPLSLSLSRSQHAADNG